MNTVNNLEWATVSEQNKYSKGIPIIVGTNKFKSLREASLFLKIDRGTLKRKYT